MVDIMYPVSIKTTSPKCIPGTFSRISCPVQLLTTIVENWFFRFNQRQSHEKSYLSPDTFDDSRFQMLSICWIILQMLGTNSDENESQRSCCISDNVQQKARAVMANWIMRTFVCKKTECFWLMTRKTMLYFFKVYSRCWWHRQSRRDRMLNSNYFRTLGSKWK